MFTGIVEEVGSVKSVGEGRLVIGAREVLSDVKVGESISVNGACLTVTTHDDASFSVDVVPETLRRTNLGELTAGSPVNLERSMPANGRFGGHMVQGHVDGTATIRSIESEGDALMVVFDAPSSVMRYVWKRDSSLWTGRALPL